LRISGKAWTFRTIKKPETKTPAPGTPHAFPRSICLERCTMNIKKGYETHILKTLRAFSNETLYHQKFPHKLEDRQTWSIDVKSRNDKYRMLFRVENGICKITDLCTEKTH